MLGPPLPGRGGPVVSIMVVPCARATGAKTSMARRATMVSKIALFIHSSFSTLSPDGLQNFSRGEEYPQFTEPKRKSLYYLNNF
jgi:hypothetical protein